MNIKIVRIEKDLPLPEYKTSGAVGFDLYARTETTLPPHKVMLVPTNLIVEVPKGHALLVLSRSSTTKKGLWLANGVGVVDSDYHGPTDEIQLAAYNFTENDVVVLRGERIAQALIVPVVRAEWEEVEIIKEESRGGFGSTG
ncbi:MAG: dUTP diphosphatase [Patescibacteria group bacterium]